LIRLHIGQATGIKTSEKRILESNESDRLSAIPALVIIMFNEKACRAVHIQPCREIAVRESFIDYIPALDVGI
jgi:hypothetical protein